MLKAMIEKIESMAAPKTYEVDGVTYSSKALCRVEPKRYTPKSIELSSLESVCRMVRHEAAHIIGDTIYIKVSDYRNVHVFTQLDPEMERDYLYACRADVPAVTVGAYMPHEKAIIQLQSLYMPGDGAAYLLNLLSSVSKESKVTSSDNGVTQTVQAKSGIALTTAVEVKPRVNLQPFRTFLEVEQPESLFILRLDDDGDIGLFEADGGVWKLEATRNIAAYFERSLEDLINAGQVVVLR